jgi:hemerythrin-like domain-containing protein
MRLIDELRAEHELIDRVLESLRSWTEHAGDPADGAAFAAFFRLYAGAFHHAREEDTLFVALHKEAELPLDRGPIHVLEADHHRLGAVLETLAPRLIEGVRDEHTAALAREYSRGLWHHIDAENSVLFPEAEERLRIKHVRELPSRAPTAEEASARAEGERLAAKYPRFHDAEVLRGDGCVMCPAYGDTCRGLEREWWNDNEWDELPDRASSG